MDNLNKLIAFLDELEKQKIFYTLGKIRDSILVSVAVPGERWEIEFMSSGDIEIEKFKSNGEIYDNHEMTKLFKLFSK